MSLKNDFLSIFPTSLEEMSINPWTMMFKGQEEQTYWRGRVDKELGQKRIGIIVGFMIYLAFAMADLLVMPTLKDLAWSFRFGLFMPLSLIAFIVTYLSYGKQWIKPIASVLLFLSGAIHVVILWKAPLAAASLYHMGIVIFVVFGFALLRTTFLYTAMASLGMLLIYMTYLFSASPFTTAERLTALILVIVGTFVAGAGGYMLEYAQRRNYYLTAGRGSGKVIDKTKSQSASKAKEEPRQVIKTVESPVNKLFENLNDMVWFISLEGEIKYISPASKEFLGYEPEDLTGKRAVTIMANDSYSKFDQLAARLYRDKNRVQETFEYKTKAGLIKSGDVVMTKFQDKRFGEGYIGSTRPALEVVHQVQQAEAVEDPQVRSLKEDLEDIKQVNRQLVQEAEDLKGKIMIINTEQAAKVEVPLDALAEVLERVSVHYAEVTKVQLNEHYKELEIIGDKYSHMTMSKHDLENYFKVAKGKIHQTANGLDVLKDRLGLFKSFLMPADHLHLQTYQMRTLLEESVLKLKQFFKNTKHVIDIDCPRGIEILTDKAIFEQVINNMIMHSLQFSFAHIRNGSIEIAVEKVEGQVFITYRDNGDKLQSDVIDEMFARMIQEDLTDLEGMELHLVRQIVEKHLAGSIGCEYDTQKNTFRIVLPIQR